METALIALAIVAAVAIGAAVIFAQKAARAEAAAQSSSGLSGLLRTALPLLMAL